MNMKKSIKKTVWTRAIAAVASILLFSFVTTANILRIQSVQDSNTQEIGRASCRERGSLQV